MKTMSKIFLCLTIILVIILPISAKDLNLSSDHSNASSLSPSQISTNFTNDVISKSIPLVSNQASSVVLSQDISGYINSSIIMGSISVERSYVAFTKDPITNREYASDQIIVRFKSQNTTGISISSDKINSAHAKIGAKIKKDFSTDGISGLQVVQLPSGIDVQSAVREYQSNPDVLYAEPDYVVRIAPEETTPLLEDSKSLHILSTSNDLLFNDLWGLNNTGQFVNGISGTPGADINAIRAWDLTTGSNSVVVAVVDTGVQYTHGDLATNIWTNPGEIPGNGIDDDHNGYVDDIHGWNFVANTSDPLDNNGHGTHVSGTIGAVGNNSLGVTGVNWQVKIMAVKFLDSLGNGFTSDAISAIRYADVNGASVISNSWSGPDNSPSLKAAIDASSGVVVCAAGNDGLNNDFFIANSTPQYPASFTSANIISVAATDQNDNLAGFSNFGPLSVDLGAPGTNILSTSVTGSYVYMQGTSMATPHVSGVAALVKSRNASLTAIQIKNIILSTVDLKSSLSGKVSTSGRLNAYRAVMSANPPVSDFAGTPRNGIAPLTVSFTDLSSNFPNSWHWSFGDGNITNSTVQNPVHTYLAAANYSVSLTASNAAGGTISTKTGYIHVTNGTLNLTTKIGVYQNGVWFLDYDGDGLWNPSIDKQYTFGAVGLTPVTGDWNGDGKMKIGITNGMTWLLDYDGDGLWNPSIDKQYTFGAVGLTPVTGDWNGDGKMKIGITNGMTWLLDYDGSGIWNPSIDKQYTFGAVGFTPVTGDWNGDGKMKIGITNGMTWLLDYDGNGIWNPSIDKQYTFGAVGLTPVTGDWNGDGKMKIGITNGMTWLLDYDGNGIWNPSIDKQDTFGAIGFTPVMGDWNGDGKAKIGITNGMTWLLDYDGNGIWNPSIDKQYTFGTIGWTPVVAKWN